MACAAERELYTKRVAHVPQATPGHHYSSRSPSPTATTALPSAAVSTPWLVVADEASDANRSLRYVRARVDAAPLSQVSATNVLSTSDVLAALGDCLDAYAGLLHTECSKSGPPCACEGCHRCDPLRSCRVCAMRRSTSEDDHEEYVRYMTFHGLTFE